VYKPHFEHLNTSTVRQDRSKARPKGKPEAGNAADSNRVRLEFGHACRHNVGHGEILSPLFIVDSCSYTVWAFRRTARPWLWYRLVRTLRLSLRLRPTRSCKPFMLGVRHTRPFLLPTGVSFGPRSEGKTTFLSLMPQSMCPDSTAQVLIAL
jgi:hypothetical protein